MKVKFPLYLQTVAFMVLNLAVLGMLFLLFFNTQFGMGWEAIMASPLGERVETLSFVLHQQLRARPPSSWDETLNEFGKIYGVKFAVFDRHGNQVAGDSVTLPDAIAMRVSRHRRTGAGDAGPPPLATTATPLDLSMTSRDRGPHTRFLVHTTNPELFWVGTRFFIPLDRSDDRGRAPEAGLPPGPPGMPGTLIATCPNLWYCRLFFDVGSLLVVVGTIFAVSVVTWSPFVYMLTKSLSDVTAVTERIAEGHFDARLKVKRADELGRLADAVNSMAERLQSFVAGQKRFLGDTAHELCSPVSRLRVALELLQSSGTPDQEASIKDISEDVEEMSNLINELLAFSKAGLQGKEIQLELVNITAVLNAVVEKTASQSLVTREPSDDLYVQANQLLLERAFNNVLRNAVRYASQDGPITVKAVRAGQDAVITITDCGPGVPPEALKLLGQPFYRPEPSRSRSSGGVGLGLAIVKTCVEACSGTFKVRNHQPRGLQVEVRLPAKDPPSPTPPKDAAVSESSV